MLAFTVCRPQEQKLNTLEKISGTRPEAIRRTEYRCVPSAGNTRIVEIRKDFKFERSAMTGHRGERTARNVRRRMETHQSRHGQKHEICVRGFHLQHDSI